MSRYKGNEELDEKTILHRATSEGNKRKKIEGQISGSRLITLQGAEETGG